MAINAGKNFVSGALNGKFNASCFAAGTMIETADGDRTIEEIQIGDLVLSANPETGEIAYKPVVNTYVHVTDTVLYLTIDEEIIETTFDAASLAFDIVSFCIEPTPMGAVDILTDVVGLVTPGVPSAGLKVGVHAAETAYDAYKAVDTAHDLSQAADVVITVSKKGDAVLELADTAKDAKKISNAALGEEVLIQGKTAVSSTYKRPSHFRKGIRDQVWENAKNAEGKVIDRVTGREIHKNEPWDMGHLEKHEFWKHQIDAQNRGISRKQFLDEYNDPAIYRPELPSSNRSHIGEDKTNRFIRPKGARR